MLPALSIVIALGSLPPTVESPGWGLYETAHSTSPTPLDSALLAPGASPPWWPASDVPVSCTARGNFLVGAARRGVLPATGSPVVDVPHSLETGVLASVGRSGSGEKPASAGPGRGRKEAGFDFAWTGGKAKSN